MVITDRYSKLARAVPLDTSNTDTVADAFLGMWIYPYGVPDYLLTDNGSQFISEFFERICAALGTTHLRTTAYHPATNGQAERYNRTLAQRLRHYVSEHQDDWDDFVQPLTYAYNMQVHKTTNTTPFALSLTRHPPEPVIDAPTRPPSTAANPRGARARTIHALKEALAQASKSSQEAQQRYKRYFDSSVRLKAEFKTGDEVFVNRPPAYVLSQEEKDVGTPQSKLLDKSVGPFTVVRASPVTVTIREDGVEYTVSVDRCSKAPPDRDAPPPPPPLSASPAHPAPHDDSDFVATSLEPECTAAAPAPVRRDITRILRHHGHGADRVYDVQLRDGTELRAVTHTAVPRSVRSAYEKSRSTRTVRTRGRKTQRN